MTAISIFCHEITFGGLLLLQMLAGATAILLLAGVAVLLLRSRSAALRHRIWTLSMTALLALPVLAMFLPALGPQWLSDTPTFDLGTTSEPPDAESISTVGTGLDSVISDRFATDQPGTRHYTEFSGSRRTNAHRPATPGPVGGNLRSAGSPPTPHGASLYLWNAVVGICRKQEMGITGRNACCSSWKTY
ncbi:MAG: hypothetical protein ACC645_20760 [Pirellulales bacterium]